MPLLLCLYRMGKRLNFQRAAPTSRKRFLFPNMPRVLLCNHVDKRCPSDVFVSYVLLHFSSSNIPMLCSGFAYPENCSCIKGRLVSVTNALPHRFRPGLCLQQDATNINSHDGDLWQTQDG